MKHLFLMVLVLFMVENVVGVEQNCEYFLDENFHNVSYYSCVIYNANLTDDNEPVTTNTELNRRSNDDVTAVYYGNGRVVKFIPNSLFTIFINLEHLWIDANNKFEIIKPEFFKNANKLKILGIPENDIKILQANLFVNALNLKNIILAGNKIEFIHKLAFNGLKNLKLLFLEQNKISNLHPSTFSFISKLKFLELSNNTCISQWFFRPNRKVLEVEKAIEQSCAPGYTPDELAGIEAAKKLTEQQRIAAAD